MKKLIKIIVLSLAAALVMVAEIGAQSARQIELGDPIYDFLERAKVNKWLDYVPEVRPYFAKQALEYLQEISGKAKSGAITLTEGETTYLDDEIDILAKGREHLAQTPPDTMRFAFDFGGNIYNYSPINRFEDSFPHFAVSPYFELSMADTLFISARLELFGEFALWTESPFPLFQMPLEADNTLGVFDLSTNGVVSDTRKYHNPGERQFAGGFNDWLQTSLDLGPAQISFSREALDWGPGLSSRLLLSSTAKPYESLWLNMPIGDVGNFSWMMGFLQEIRPLWSPDKGQKFLNVHRLELKLTDWMSFAIDESVVYAPDFYAPYLLPLGLLIVDQVRTGAYGKKSLGLDFLFGAPHFSAYVSSFVDDWNLLHPLSLSQFRDTYGLLLGVRTQDLFVPGLSVNFEAGYASKWLYTSGAAPDKIASYTNFGTNLGSEMQPNSVLLTLEGEYALSPVLKPGLKLQWNFHGDGNSYITYDPAHEATIYGVADANDVVYSFLDMNSPNGVPIASVFNASLYLDWFVPKLGLKLHGDYTLQIYANKDNQAGKDGVDNILNFYVSIFAY